MRRCPGRTRQLCHCCSRPRPLPRPPIRCCGIRPCPLPCPPTRRRCCGGCPAGIACAALRRLKASRACSVGRCCECGTRQDARPRIAANRSASASPGPPADLPESSRLRERGPPPSSSSSRLRRCSLRRTCSRNASTADAGIPSRPPRGATVGLVRPPGVAARSPSPAAVTRPLSAVPPAPDVEEGFEDVRWRVASL